MRSRRWLPFHGVGLCRALAVMWIGSGCSGAIDGAGASGGEAPPGEVDPTKPGARPPDGPPGSSPSPAPGASAPAGPGAAAAAGPMPLRRLSRQEYANTVRDLLGDLKVDVSLPTDPIGESTYASPSNVGAVELDRFAAAANGLAAAVKLEALAPCAAGREERACAGDFVRAFGQRAFRRPVQDDEAAAFLALYDTLRKTPAGQTHAEAVRTLLATILQSPQFLYHWELGGAKATREGQLVRLGGWEIASRLSYFVWATMPDDALFAAAQAGRLDTAAGVAAEATRLVADVGRAKALSTGMFGQWLALDKVTALQKDTKVIATLGDDVKTGMQAEAERFLQKAVLEDGTFTSLLTSRASFVTAATAKLYGLTGVTSTTLVAQTLPPERAGVFTQLAFLAVKALPQESSPVHRGKLVLERLLCRQVQPPPPGLNVTPPKIAEGGQTRAAYEQHGKDPACAGCHSAMDPLGFAFESFDAVGRYRKQEAGRDVDTTGTVSLDGASASFANAGELMATLAKSPEARACMATQLARFALGRRLVAADDAALAAAKKDLTSSEDLRALVVAIAKSDAFRLRAPAPGEVLE